MVPTAELVWGEKVVLMALAVLRDPVLLVLTLPVERSFSVVTFPGRKF